MENLLIQLFSTSIVHFEGNNFSPKYAFQFCLRKIQSFDSMFMIAKQNPAVGCLFCQDTSIKQRLILCTKNLLINNWSFCGLIKQFRKEMQFKCEQPFLGEKRRMTRQKQLHGRLHVDTNHALCAYLQQLKQWTAMD